MDATKIIFAQIQDMLQQTIALLPQLGIALVVLIVTWVIDKLVSLAVAKVLARTRLRPSLKSLFNLLISIGIWILGLMIAAVIVFPNLTPASILAGLGIGSVAVGFAFKDIFENFLAGIIILFRREMRIGDFIECEGLSGRVESILVRETHIRQTDGQLVIAPNAMLFKNPLKIRTALDQRRTTIICGVAYKEDVDESRAVIRKAVESCDTVITQGRPIQIFAQEFADSSINFEVTWWTGSKPVDIRISRDQVIAAVKRALDEAGIEIPFPYRTLTFDESLRIEQRDAKSDAGD